MRTYCIELEIDFDGDEERYDIIKDMMMTSAREVYTAAILIADKRQTRIALHSKDFFHGQEDIELAGENA